MLCLVHPCDRNHGCEQKCIQDNTAKKFHCECKSPEFKLAGNGKNCTEGKFCQGQQNLYSLFNTTLIILYSLFENPFLFDLLQSKYIVNVSMVIKVIIRNTKTTSSFYLLRYFNEAPKYIYLHITWPSVDVPFRNLHSGNGTNFREYI